MPFFCHWLLLHFEDGNGIADSFAANIGHSGAVRDQLYFSRRLDHALGHAMGWALIMAGIVLAGWAVTEARTIDVASPSKLVTTGPYTVSRNPMYLGLLLALAALGLWLQSLSALLLTPLFVLVINRCNILPEERRLRDSFGAAYETYLTQTRRWL